MVVSKGVTLDYELRTMQGDRLANVCGGFEMVPKIPVRNATGRHGRMWFGGVGPLYEDSQGRVRLSAPADQEWKEIKLGFAVPPNLEVPFIHIDEDPRPGELKVCTLEPEDG